MATTRQRTIGTHSGTFHCDEAMACFMLQQLPAWRDARVVRTRDPATLAACDIVVDVGGEYNAAQLRFDHHQRGFTETLSADYSTKLSSAGLIYKHFGREVITEMTGLPPGDDMERVYARVYRALIESIDAIDNGINRYPSDVPSAYALNTDLSARVAHLNPEWNEVEFDLDALFREAMRNCGTEFTYFVRHYALAWLPARSLVARALDARAAVHPSGAIAVLESGCPWADFLFEIERELDIAGQILYVVFPDSSSGWRVRAVSTSSGSFDMRKPLPEAWRGVRDAALDALVGGEAGCVFVHASGFIGGHATRNGALRMASLAVDA